MTHTQRTAFSVLFMLFLAAFEFGYWQHSVAAGVFAFAALYALMPYQP